MVPLPPRSLSTAQLVAVSVCALIVLFGLLRVFNKPRVPVGHGPPKCISNVKQLALGLLLYSQDYDETLPVASQWSFALNPLIRTGSVFRCPQVGGKRALSYAFNIRLDSVRHDKLTDSANCVMIFDAEPDSKPAGGQELLPNPPRHEGNTHNIGFVDGHTKSVTGDSARTFVWSPRLKPAP